MLLMILSRNVIDITSKYIVGFIKGVGVNDGKPRV